MMSFSCWEAGILAQRKKMSIGKKRQNDVEREKCGKVFSGVNATRAENQAALAAFLSVAAAASSHLTETSFETPGSCIVTP